MLISWGQGVNMLIWALPINQKKEKEKKLMDLGLEKEEKEVGKY